VTTILPPVSQTEWDRWQRCAAIVAVSGCAAFAVIGLVLYFLGGLPGPVQFFLSYLVAYNFWLEVALGSLVILMLQYVTGGAWGFVIRRVLESGTRTLLLLAVLFIPILLGMRFLYEWAQPDLVAASENLRHKRPYLNVPFFIIRAILYFVIWLALTFFLNRWSALWDRDEQSGSPRRFRVLSAPGLVLYGITITFASIDWVMSLEPDWYSTIYPVLFGLSQVLAAFAFAIAVFVLLATRRPLIDVIHPGLMRDLGNMLLAFVMFWAYLAVSQFLLIWIADLPEEIPWYLRRTRAGWQWLGILLIVAHFAVPFVLLLSRDIKENRRSLIYVALLILVMRFLDLLWWIEPAYPHSGQYFFWLLDVAALVGLGGVWSWWFLRQLQQRPLLPMRGPFLAEAMPND
jgi:hypothetical protein